MLIAADICTLLAQTAPPSAPAVGGDTPWVVYGVIAFGMALSLLVLEAFVPSGGVLGILAGIAAIIGVVLFFRFDTTWGMVSMAASLVALPFVIAAMLWVWPNTPIGRALTLEESQQRYNDTDRPIDDDAPQAITVGLEGEAITELRPVGACRLNGKRIDCIAQSGLIRPGTKVRVVRVEGITVKVAEVSA